MEETGRVELHEFHVGEGRSGAVRHGHSVTGSDVGVAGVEIDFPRPSGGEHGNRREKLLNPVASAVEDIRPKGAVGFCTAGAVTRHEIDRTAVFEAS